MNAKTKLEVGGKVAEQTASNEHSVLYTFLSNEKGHFVSKMQTCVDMLRLAVASMTDTLRNHNGAVQSIKNGGTKGTTPAGMAKGIIGAFGTYFDLYLAKVVTEAIALLPGLEGIAEKGTATLGVVTVKDKGEGNYSMVTGSQLERFKASLMTLSGDWSYLYGEYKTNADVQAFVNKWQQYTDKGSAMGFSPAYAFSVLQGANAAQILEDVACHKSEVSRSIKADNDGGDGSEQTGATDETGGTEKYTPQVESLLKVVNDLKLAIVAIAPNVTVQECDEYAAQITAIITSMNEVSHGDSEGSQVSLPVDTDAPVIEESKIPVPISAGIIKSK